MWVPNIFRDFWVGGSDRDGKWRQGRRGGRGFVAFWGFKHELSRIITNFSRKIKKNLLKGVGAEHQVLMSATYICECEHSHLYVSLISARPCRATPFKKRKSPLWRKKKGEARKKPPDPDSFFQEFENLRIIFKKEKKLIERCRCGAPSADERYIHLRMRAFSSVCITYQRTALPCYTFQKEKKSSLEEEKRQSQKKNSGSRFYSFARNLGGNL